MIFYTQFCDPLSYRPVTPSKVAVALPAAQIGATHTFERCLYVQVGVEHGDGAQLSAALKEIRRIARMADAKSLVINGFAGLADRRAAAEPALARRVLTEMTTRLENAGWPVHTMPFGWNKALHLDVLDGEWQQRVTDFSAPALPAAPTPQPDPQRRTRPPARSWPSTAPQCAPPASPERCASTPALPATPPTYSTPCNACDRAATHQAPTAAPHRAEGTHRG